MSTRQPGRSGWPLVFPSCLDSMLLWTVCIGRGEIENTIVCTTGVPVGRLVAGLSNLSLLVCGVVLAGGLGLAGARKEQHRLPPLALASPNLALKSNRFGKLFLTRSENFYFSPSHPFVNLPSISKPQLGAAAMETPALSLSSTMDSTDQSTIPRPIDASTGTTRNKQKQPSPQPSVDEESHPSPSDASQDEVAAAKNDAQWMTGNPLLALLCLISTSMFLVMLDTSIIATAVGAHVVHSINPHRLMFRNN